MAPYKQCRPSQISRKYNLEIIYVVSAILNLIYLFLLYKQYKNKVKSNLLTFLIIILILVNISTSGWEYANNIYQI